MGLSNKLSLAVRSEPRILSLDKGPAQYPCEYLDSVNTCTHVYDDTE